MAECIICFHKLTRELAALPCGHVYHSNCIRNSFTKVFQQCPVCRRNCAQDDIIQLHLNIETKPVGRCRLVIQRVSSVACERTAVRAASSLPPIPKEETDLENQSKKNQELARKLDEELRTSQFMRDEFHQAQEAADTLREQLRISKNSITELERQAEGEKRQLREQLQQSQESLRESQNELNQVRQRAMAQSSACPRALNDSVFRDSIGSWGMARSNISTASASCLARCQAITRKGTQCLRSAGAGGYCWQHN